MKSTSCRGFNTLVYVSKAHKYTYIFMISVVHEWFARFHENLAEQLFWRSRESRDVILTVDSFTGHALYQKLHGMFSWLAMSLLTNHIRLYYSYKCQELILFSTSTTEKKCWSKIQIYLARGHWQTLKYTASLGRGKSILWRKVRY